MFVKSALLIGVNQLIAKHVALFIIGLLWLLLVVSYGTQVFLTRAKNESIETKLIITRTFILVLGVISIFSIQLNYYHKVDSYIDYRCEYYDKHHNLIFASPRIYSCPELNVIEETEYTLTFTTSSTYLGMNNIDSLYLVDITFIDSNPEVFVESLTKTTIEYDEDYHVTYYENQLSEIIHYEENVVYTSTIKIVENVYQINAFETTVSTASVIDYSLDDLIHYPFQEADYQHIRTYTSIDNILDYPISDINFYIIQSTDEIDSDEVVGLGLETGDVMINLTEDLSMFTLSEFGNWSQTEGTYLRFGQWDKPVDSDGVHDYIFSLGYSKKDEGYYALTSKNQQEPSEYYFQSDRSLSFGNLTFQDEGHDSYFVMDGIYYTFTPTDYGYKVIDRRSHQYQVFTSLDVQKKEQNLSIMNDQYLNLYDYYKNLVEYPYYAPQIIVNQVNPLRLKTLK